MGPEQALTRAQRNDLYKSVKQGGLDLTKCYFSETYRPLQRKITRPALRFGKLVLLEADGYDEPAAGIAEIRHLPSGSTFTITNRAAYIDRSGRHWPPTYYYVSLIAGEEKSNWADPRWTKVAEAAHQWAENVRHECVDPDFWAELSQGRSLPISVGTRGNVS